MMKLSHIVERWLCLFLLHVTLLMSLGVESAMTKGLANATDALALLAFKQQIRRDPSHALSTWNESLPFCQWQGITCGRLHHQRVVAMNLTRLELVGTLSPFISNLTFLREIDLSQNELQGQIPQEFGRLFRIRYLNLSHNSMGGEIPANLTHCWRLETIDFSFNELIGRIPFELGSLSRLRRIYLAKNNLSGSIPTSIGNLSSLTHLALMENGLQGNIPEELGHIRSLHYLHLSMNKLYGAIPPTLYNLSSMAYFFATANELNGSLPPDVGDTLPNLVQFYVAQNQFTGPIPVSMPNASRLESLAFSSNQFSGPIPMNIGRLGGLRSLYLEKNLLGSGETEDMGALSSLTNCSFLEEVTVSYNRLTGALPSSIANLSTNLNMLYLGKNQMFGSIPSGIGNLHNLIVLGLSFNFMTGTIPEGIGMLNKLQVLNLRTNRFSGEIPAFIGNNTQLFQFLVAENNFQGSIPSTLKNCQRLSLLHLAHNNLIGYIPKQVFSIMPLRYLNVKGNSLVGSLPTEVGNLKGLRILIVSDNKLSGEIPRSLDNCLGLENLYLEGNFFQGTLPPLNSLKGMLRMDISRNNFSGQIPEYLEELLYLRYLNLSYNNFEGEVPQEGIFKNTSAISVVGCKNLCGGTPALLLPACPSQESKKQKRRFSPRATTTILIGPILCLVLLFSILCCYLRTSKKHAHPHPHPHPITSPLEEQFLYISYGDLYKATDGFSSANLIGVGSYSSVYKGYLDRIGRIMAVKVLNLQHQGASKSFIAECKVLKNVRHRNLLKVLTVCASIDSKGDDFKALVFEYMVNGNLERWLHPNIDDEQHQSKNLNLIQRLNIAIDVASALNYLHTFCEKPIVHCDLKPSNVLLDDVMYAHVGDFGLASFISKLTSSCSQNSTNSSGIRGTIGYVAPEYGMGGEASTSGDVYSYGILLLEIFTGKRPTDEMFNESLDLHQFAKMALPERVMEIIDQSLVSIEVESLNESNNHIIAKNRLEMCLISTIRVGVACSMISARDRMEIGDAMVKMQGIRDLYLGVGIRDRNN